MRRFFTPGGMLHMHVPLCAVTVAALGLVATSPMTTAAAHTQTAAAATIPANNLTMNPSFEIPDPIERSGGEGWTGTVYPGNPSTNAIYGSVPLSSAPDGTHVARVSLNFVVTGSEFGIHDNPPTVMTTRAGAVYRASASLASANASSLGKPARLRLVETAPSGGAPVQTTESTITLTTAFQRLTTSLQVARTGDSVGIYLVQEGASLSHSPLDAFYADLVTLVGTPPVTTPPPVPVDPAIPTGCSPTSPDVTVALNQWLSGVPDFSVLQFPANACYHVEGTLFIHERHNLVLEGNGAQLQAFTLGVDAPKPTGAGADVAGMGSKWPTNRSSVTVLDSTDLTVRSLHAIGPNTTCKTMYSTLPAVDSNAQNGFTVARSNRVLLDKDTVHGVYGDFVTGASGSDQLTVQGGDYECSGNVGLHVMWATHVTFQGNKVVECGAACFSMEPMRSTWIEQHILVDNNDVYPLDPNWSNTGAFFSNQGAGGDNVGDVTISNNRVHGKGIGILVSPGTAPTTYRSHYRILNNSTDTATGAIFTGVIHLNDVNDVLIQGNTQTFIKLPPGTTGITRAVNIEGSNNVTVKDNNFAGVMKVLETQYLSTHLAATATAGASTIMLAASPDGFEPPLLIDGELRYVERGGISGSGPYRVELHNRLLKAHAVGARVISAPTTKFLECGNITGKGEKPC